MSAINKRNKGHNSRESSRRIRGLERKIKVRISYMREDLLQKLHQPFQKDLECFLVFKYLFKFFAPLLLCRSRFFLFLFLFFLGLFFFLFLLRPFLLFWPELYETEKKFYRKLTFALT